MAQTNFSGPVNSVAGFEVNGTAITATPSELNTLTGVTAGTAAASKAVVLDANKGIAGIVNISVDTGTKTAAATAGAATLNKTQGAITSEALTTAAGSDYVLTLTNSAVAAADMVIAEVQNGTNTTEGLSVHRVQPASGSCVIRVRNTHAADALNGTIVIKFLVIKA